MAYRTFGELQTFAMEMLSEEETDAVFSGGLLNRWAQRVRDRINHYSSFTWKQGNIRLTWPGISSSEPAQPITSVLYLPEDVGEIQSMYPTSLAYREPVQIQTRWEFDQDRPGGTVVRGRDILVLWGYYGVRRDNPNTTTLDITASGGINASGLKCVIVGRDQDNEAIQEEVELDDAGEAFTVNTFLGGVAQDGVTRFSIVKSTLTPLTNVGVVKLLSSGVELESLNADQGEIAKERRRTELYAQVSGPGQYEIAYFRRPKPLVAGSDLFLPELPNEFSDIPESGIMQLICMFRKETDMMAVYKAEFNERMKELIAWDNRRPGQKGRFTVRNQFGRGGANARS